MKNWSTKNILIVSFGALLAIAFIAGGGFLQGTPLEKPLMTIGPIIILFLMIYVPFVIIRLIYRKISKSSQAPVKKKDNTETQESPDIQKEEVTEKKVATKDTSSKLIDESTKVDKDDDLFDNL
tara:strand:- start:110 stop:481 length:372 start_codon:yes stop_codon:yes gene_type:complete